MTHLRNDPARLYVREWPRARSLAFLQGLRKSFELSVAAHLRSLKLPALTSTKKDAITRFPGFTRLFLLLLSQVFERGTMAPQECEVGGVSEIVSSSQ